MKIIETKFEPTEVLVKVEFKGKEWSEQMHASFNKISKNIKIDGFRPGKIPAHVVQEHIGTGGIVSDAVNTGITNFLDHFWTDPENKELITKIVEGTPSVTYDKVEKDGIVFTAKFEPTPNVTVDKYDNLAITPETEAVTESEIDNEVNRLIQQDIMLKPKSADKPVADGDNVNIDFKGLRDGKEFPGGSSKDFDLIIGSKTFIDGFETQLIGMKLNETKTIDIVFPDDYGKVDMRGQKVQFEVKINSIAEVIKPELTPAYLEKFSFAVMKNENDLRLAIKRNLTESKELSAKENLKQKVSRELLTRIHISYIPKAYIINERNRLLRQTEGEAQQHHTSLDHYIKSLGFKNDEEYQFAIADAAKSNVTVALGFEHIVAEQKIVVTDKDVEQYLEKLAKVYKTTVPAIKSQLQNNFEGVKGFIMQEKVVEHILSVNKIKG